MCFRAVTDWRSPVSYTHLAIAQLGQYLQSPEEDDVDESGILQVLHKVELKEADSEYLQARTANIMEKIPEIDEKLNQAAAGWKTCLLYTSCR